MPLCTFPGPFGPIVTFLPQCPDTSGFSSLPNEVPGTGPGSPIAGAVGSTAQGVAGSVLPQFPVSWQNIGDWVGGVNAQDHWKGVGLLAAGVMVAIFGFIMFTSTGKTTVNIAKSAAG